MKSEVRNSNIELLRIFAAFCVVALHFNESNVFNNEDVSFLNKYLCYFIESISICAVDLFILISGYFLSSTNKRSINKPFELIFLEILIQLTFYIYKVVIGDYSLSLRNILSALTPSQYFVILYTVVYFVSPYINKLFSILKEKELKFFMILMFIIFSFYPTVLDLLREFLRIKRLGLSPITAWGSYQGFSSINFMLLYSVGAFIRFKKLDLLDIGKRKILVSLFTIVTIVFLWSLLNELGEKDGLISAWCYHNFFVILIAVGYFLFFKKFSLKNRVVNFVSKSSFVCYLTHIYFLDILDFSRFLKGNPFILVLVILAFCLFCYLVSIVCYLIYKFTFCKFFQKIKQFEIKYFDE